MIVISIALLGIASLFGNTSKALSTNETLQQAAQYAQECAESAIATRRNVSFAAASTTTICNTLPALPTEFTRTVGITTNGSAACPLPSGTICKDVLITVTSTSPALSSSITLMLVNY